MEVSHSDSRTAAGSFASASGPCLTGFEEQAMPLFNSLFNFARWLARDQHDAEDLVQETYRKALHGFRAFAPGTNFKAWMFRILKNTFLDSRSSREQRLTMLWPEEDGPELAVENETPETIFLERCDRVLVRSAIEELPEYFRSALLLCEVEEMSYQEIATALSIPIGTVMSRLARARKALRASLGNYTAEQTATLCWAARPATGRRIGRQWETSKGQAADKCNARKKSLNGPIRGGAVHSYVSIGNRCERSCSTTPASCGGPDSGDLG